MLDTLADMCKINNKNNIISDTDPEVKKERRLISYNPSFIASLHLQVP